MARTQIIAVLGGTYDRLAWVMQAVRVVLVVRFFAVLERSVKSEARYLADLVVDPWFTSLHADPRWDRFMAKRAAAFEEVSGLTPNRTARAP